MDIYIFIILVVIALLGAFAVHLIRKPNVIKGIFISTLCFTIAGGLALYGYSYFILCPNPLVAIFRSIYAVIRLFLGEENYTIISRGFLLTNGGNGGLIEASVTRETAKNNKKIPTKLECVN